MYANIVFFQGHEAVEPINILEADGVEKALEFLLQWDDGHYHDVRKDIPVGIADQVFTFEFDPNYKNYIVSYNSGFGYIGLSKMLSEDSL